MNGKIERERETERGRGSERGREREMECRKRCSALLHVGRCVGVEGSEEAGRISLEPSR